MHEHDAVSSTNLLAARLPAWHAVRAESQTAGRGRFQRTWVSDRGGLWLSAVIPITGGSPKTSIVPLASGLAVCRALRALGVDWIRMRWPNDILVNNRKLAGLLIDQFVPGLLVVGIGINVSNRPEECDQALCGQVARLADLLTPVPPLADVMRHVLTSLEESSKELEDNGPANLLRDINALWGNNRMVQLDLDGPVIKGEFVGVDTAGRLTLRSTDNTIQFYEPHAVRLLREIP